MDWCLVIGRRPARALLGLFFPSTFIIRHTNTDNEILNVMTLGRPLRGLTDQMIMRILSRADGARFIIVNNYLFWKVFYHSDDSSGSSRVIAVVHGVCRVNAWLLV